MVASTDVADLASEQWGMITTAQARSLGFSAQDMARMANQGRLERLQHGVYRVAGAPPTPQDRLRAAWLALDPARTAAERRRGPAPAIVSHRSAADIQGLGDTAADELEFTVPARKQPRDPDVRIHRRNLDKDDWILIDGLPVASPSRVVADLAAEHVDGGHLAGILRSAIIRGNTDGARLAHALAPYAHRYGAPAGDGEGALVLLLEQADIPEALARLFALPDLKHGPTA
ncbi:type IV toxin-antitoxin system AbiEi family antitoxin domain-containing protein [Arthrobacter sp. MI7-26]|uniref:type IV toxin-antitoxin system AbiEi family antitoxin domain-containing protein n=1 Tax=Arthrobacter sp. MI7-26 TaxID=2993653 RepID=UPI00224932F3|nr:type IV toxin-antitoxin system AbiEi family antitoxin domain-containing protein [Arthrobacter sp. MI7-26]MCX2747796.1 type IV toxin-antitoxin system AbiEi family antitoxin domain-containing protein [Arthrobacter sp. MI7-26]